MKIAQVQPSYIIQTKLFRDTSLLLEIFSRQYGRVSLIAKGARSASFMSRKPSRFRSLLQPFVPLLLSWQGRTDLYNLVAAEPNGQAPLLNGQHLLCGWYLNELLMKLVVHADAQPHLFDTYQVTLEHLHQGTSFYLRQFEKRLLSTLGIIPELDRETKTAQRIEATMFYHVLPEEGIVKSNRTQNNANIFQGAVLLAAQCEDLHAVKPYLSQIKRLFRLFLNHALEGATLHSRELMHLYYKNF